MVGIDLDIHGILPLDYDIDMVIVYHVHLLSSDTMLFRRDKGASSSSIPSPVWWYAYCLGKELQASS